MTPESEIVRLRAQVDTLTQQRDAAERLEADRAWKERDALARAESAEARITAALAACDLELSDGAPSTLNKAARHSAALAIRRALEPVGEPQRCSTCKRTVDDGLMCSNPFHFGVAEPQPEPCATCGDCRWICDYDVSDEYQGCLDTRCPRNRRPCPSCVPPETP